MSGCCVYGCSNRYSKEGLKFYRIPRGNRPFQSYRRHLWLQAIKRVDWTEDTIKNARVCGAHFISGEMSMDYQSPDFVPSVFVYTKSQGSQAKMERYQRKKRRDDGVHKSSHQPSPGSDTSDQQQESNMEHDPDGFDKTEELCSTSSTTSYVQQLLKVKDEEVPHLCSSGLDQQNPELLHIKQEDVILWSRQGGQLTIKSGDNDEKPQLFQLHQIKTEDCRETEPPTCSSAEHMKTETDGEDCGGPEPGPGGSRAKWQTGDQQLLKVKQEGVPHLCSFGLDQQNPELLIIKKEEEELQCSVEGELLPVKSEYDANTHLQPNADEKAPGSPGTEDSNDYNIENNDDADRWDENMPDSRYENEDSDEDWMETRTSRPRVKTNAGDKVAKEAISCPQCRKQFVHIGSLQKHMTSHSGGSSSSLVEEKRSSKKQTGTWAHEKPFGCDTCGKRFSRKYTLENHMTVHTGEKPFTCNDCGKTFRTHFLFQLHMKPHWKEIT